MGKAQLITANKLVICKLVCAIYSVNGVAKECIHN